LDIKSSNRIKSLLHTTAIRLSLKYSLIYIFIFGVIFLFLYWFINSFVQAQIKASLTQESKKIESIYRAKGIGAIKKYITTHRQYSGEDHRFYLLIDKNGKPQAGNLKKWPSEVETDESITNVWIPEKEIVGSIKDGDGYWPVIAINFKNGYRMLIAQGTKGTEDLRETMFAIMALIFGIIVVLIIVLGFSLGKNVLWHIENINKTYNAIMNGDLSIRIKTSSKDDEFDMIANQINKMLDKIEQLVTEAKQITNNIAHDLRKPLNRLRNRLEISIIDKNRHDCNKILEKTVADIDDIIKTFNAILEIAQAESAAAKKAWSNVNISGITSEVAELYRPLAEDKSIELNVNIAEEITIEGNSRLITQSIGNILDNAIKYTPKNGTIDVCLKESEKSIEISVSDSGPGVSSKDYKRITKRFVRLDSSRHTPGNGLGLSLVEAAAKLHDADLVFADNRPGLSVRLIFKKPSIPVKKRLY